MSHMKDIEVLVKILEALQMAGQECGMVLERRSHYRWYGRYMGDYPLPAGITREMLGKCDYVLTLPDQPQAYEVGVVAQPDGTYRLLHDFWNGGYGLEAAIGKNGQKLVNAYNAAAIKYLNAANGAVGFEEQLVGDVRVIDAVYQ